MIYIGTDWHLWKYSKKLGKCIKRPEFDEIIKCAEDTLAEDDFMIYLGDLTDDEFASTEKLIGLLKNVSGYKIMVRGNNDALDNSAYLAAGFDRVVDICTLGNLIFSHKPIYVGPLQINVHGHNHGSENELATPQNIDAWGGNRYLTPLEDVICGNEPDFSISITDHFWTAASPKHEVISGTIFDLEEYYINGVDNAPIDESVFRKDDELEVSDLLESIEENTIPKKEEAINYLRHIKYLTEAFFSEEVIGTSKNESLEMLIGKKPVTTKNGMVTLYHGSPEVDLQVIKATSLNVGTRLSSPRSSSFWADEPAVAIIMSIWKMLASDGKLFDSVAWLMDFKKRKFVVSNSSKAKFNLGMKSKIMCLYVATIPIAHVGKGHDPDINEYSVDIDVYPHHHSLMGYKDFIKYVRFVSDDEFKRLIKSEDRGSGIKPRKVPFRDRLIYHNNFRITARELRAKMDTGEAIGLATFEPVAEAAYNKMIYDRFFAEESEPTLDEAASWADRKLKRTASWYDDSKKSPNLNETLYPVYITIFSNDTSFGKLIRKATGSDFSHATISLDPSMNNMYSFSDVPYNHARFFTAGFVRESLWSPMYTKNRYFKILVTFVTKAGLDRIQKRIDYFVKHHDQYDYNDIGLIRYYFKFKDRRNDETKKMKWFCSEFVAGAITASDEVHGFENLLASPSDLQDKPNVIDLGKFTIPTFDEKDLIRKTEKAEKVFRANKVLERSMMVESAEGDTIDESWIDAVKTKIAEKKKDQKFDEKLVNSYTYNLDWKKLYEIFIKLFPKSDPTLRFDLYELIVRNDLVKNRKSTANVMDQIIDQTKEIANKIKPATLTIVDVNSSTVFYQRGGSVGAFSYPDYEPITESAAKIKLDEVLLQDFEDAKDFETDDDVSRAHQDPDRQPTYRIRFRKKNRENPDVPTVDESVLTESKSVIDLSLPLMQPEMTEALDKIRGEFIAKGLLPSAIEEAARVTTRRVKPNVRKGEFDKAHRLQKAKKGKDPLAEASPFEGKFKSVKVDEAESMIVIKGIDFRKLMARLKNMYDTKKVSNLFDVEYTPWSLYLYNSEQIEKSQMKIKSVKVPLFFALELQQIFYDLADYYQLKYYAEIGNMIYKKTWISNVDKPVQRNEVNMNKLKGLFTIDPLPYQIGYVQEYFTITRCYNFDGHILTFKPGYGKTFTSVMIAEASPDVDQVVVVCPNTLKENWANEIRQYYKKYAANEALWLDEVYVSNNTKFNFSKGRNKWVIVNQESIPTIFDKVKSKNVMIIVDECQYFRNYETKRSGALLELKARSNATEILMMSGTPIHATPDEALTALLMIDPMMTIDLAKKYKKAFSVDNTSLEKVIKARFGIVMYDVPTDVLKLPAKHEMEMKVKLDNDEKFFLTNVAVKIAEAYRKHYSSLGENAGQYRKDFVNVLEKYSSASRTDNTMYMQFIDDGASYLAIHESKHEFYKTFIKTYIYPNVPPESLKEVKAVIANYVYMSAKARGLAIGEVLPPLYNEVNMRLWMDNEDFFVEKIRSNLKKTLIFSPYVGVVNFIADRLKARGVGAIVVTGSVIKNRQDRLNEFMHSDMIDVLVATHNVAGTGLTLIEASQVFFFGVPFRSAEYDQAANRVYRIGQTSEVYIYKVLLDSSVDKVANITTRQNDIMEWSRNMSNAYTKGAKEQVEFDYDENDYSISESTAIQRACAQYDEYNLKPMFGKETLENEWDDDYDDAYSNDEVEFEESIKRYALPINPTYPNGENMGSVDFSLGSKGYDPRANERYENVKRYSGNIYYADLSQESMETDRKFGIEVPSTNVVFYYDKISSAICQLQYCEPNSEIVEFYCDPSLRGTGVAKKVLKAAIDIYHPKNISVYSDNYPAIMMYTSMGFAIVGEEPDGTGGVVLHLKWDKANAIKSREKYFASVGILEEATLEDKMRLAATRTEPIFICLFHFSSVLSTLIAAVTKDEYSHATISFDTSLKNMYSFGKMYPNNPILGSFVHESLYGPTYDKVVKHAVYVVFVTPKEKETIKKNLDWFIRHSDRLRYNYEGLLKSLFKIPDEDGKKKCMYLCSEFVSMMLKTTGRDFISTPSNLVKPNDFQFYPWCYYLGSGEGRNYDRAAVDKKLREIIEKREAGVEAYLESANALINESLIFSKDRIELNLSNWAPGKNNILYVTGLSGSGKTTYSEELEKAGEGVIFELDGLFLGHDSSNRGIIKRLEREDDDYKYHTPKSKVTRKQFKRWINSVIRYMREDPETKYIVEGVQIYEYPGPLVDFAHDPVVIIGTSVLKSIYRRIKRAEGNDRRNQLRELKQMVGYYLDEHKMFTHFVKNATTNESWEESLPTDVDGDGAPHIDGTHKDFMMTTDPMIGDTWDEYDDPITETSTLVPLTMSDGVVIKLRPGNTFYYTAEDLRFFVAWLEESYAQLVRMLRTSEVDARAFANLKIIRAWMTKFYILANPAVAPDNKDYIQIIADNTDKLMRSYMERCVDMGISLDYVNELVEPIFNKKKEHLENLDIIDLANGEQGVIIHL